MIEVASLATLLVKVTVVVSLGLLFLRLATQQSAAFRHAIASTTLAAAALVPLSSAWLPPMRVVLKTREIQDPVDPPTNSGAALPRAPSPGPPEPGPPISSLLLIGWAAGSSVCLLPALAMGYQSRRIRRQGQAWGVTNALVPTLSGLRRRRIPVLLHDGLSSPVACGVVSPAIALPTSSSTWSALDLQRALVHEVAHVKRADMLVQAVARAVCAAYWFHPLVWVCWRMLRAEAERACDDAVLGQFDSTGYAAQLVRMARGMPTDRASGVLPTMARHGELTARVHAILDARQCRSPLGISRVVPMILLGVSCAAWLGCLHPAIVYAVRARALQPLAFAAATVRESAPGESMSLARHQDGSVRITAAPLRVLVRLAYGVQDSAIVDAPAWMASTRYTIDATPPERASAGTTLSMMRALLAERFALRVAHESRHQRVFVLSASADARGLLPPTRCSPIPMINPASPTRTHAALPQCGFHVAPGLIEATGVDVHALAATLSTQLGGQVIVESARSDHFDVRLRWTVTGGGASTLIEALRTQVGASVFEQQRRVPVVAIQSVRRPT